MVNAGIFKNHFNLSALSFDKVLFNNPLSHKSTMLDSSKFAVIIAGDLR
jgi:hypothetical protein